MKNNAGKPPSADSRTKDPRATGAGVERPLSVKRWLLWGAGFPLLFAINAAVEGWILPRLGLDGTPRNDIYFQSWWMVVGIWFLFGHALLNAVARPDPARESGHYRTGE